MSSREEKRPAVPKFSSFKPKPAAEAAVVQKKEEIAQRPKADVRQQTEREAKANERHRRPARPDSASVSNDRARDGNHVNTARRGAPAERLDGAVFTIDKRGDPQILRYGGNYKHDVPAYRRFGSGRILGADGYLRIDRLGNREEFYFRGFTDGASALSDRRSTLAKAARDKARPVRIRKAEADRVTGSEDYLPLKSSKKRKRGQEEPEQSSGEEEASYRSIHGKSKPHEHSDSDEKYDSDSSSSSAAGHNRPSDDPMKVKSIELYRTARDHPEDTNAWLELVDHQDVLLRVGEGGGHHVTSAEIKSFAEIKLSHLEQALKHSKLPAQQERVLLRIMLEGAKVWDPKTLGKRWTDLLKDHGESFQLWKSYMNFRQTDLASFRFEEIKQLYIERLQRIRNEIGPQASTDLGPQASTNLGHSGYKQLIHAFTKTTRFLADCGFAELATAAWQAVLELNLYRPPENADAALAIPPTFQDFWESEVPRIGEDGSEGWAAFELSGGTQEPPEPRSFDAGETPNTRDAYKAWATTELRRALNAKAPARTLDDGSDDDPYRVVMYADIQDLLWILPSSALQSVKNHIIEGLFVFWQLPPPFGLTEFSQELLRDPLLRSAPVIQPLTDANSLSAANEDEHVLKPPEFNLEGHSMVESIEVLFPNAKWFSYLNPLKGHSPPDLYHLVLNTIRTCTRKLGFGELATYDFAFEWLNEKGTERKVAKALLKQCPTIDSLYSGYALIEWSNGNVESARNVLSAATNVTAIDDEGRIRMALTWAWIMLEEGNLSRGIARLCALGNAELFVESTDDEPEARRPRSTWAASSDHDGFMSSPTELIKAKQLFSSRRDYLLSSNEPERAVLYAQCLALLLYLTGNSDKEPSSQRQGDIWSAVSSIDAVSQDLANRDLVGNRAHEKLLQFGTRLLYFHATHGPHRPGFFNEQLEKYIAYFPHNTIFLSLYAWREARLGIDDRVRSLLDRVVLTQPNDSVSSRIFAIRHEMKTGNAHSARAAFEHAVQSEVCQHSAGLWISYIRFCQGRKELQAKAKEVFYRAIQQCPWSKEVFMETFTTLVRDMDSSELKSVYNTLSDKGLRVHVEMEEFVEGWRREQKQQKSGARV